MFNIHLLHNSLLNEECHWVKIKDEDVKALQEKVKNAPPKSCNFGSKQGPQREHVAEPKKSPDEGKRKGGVKKVKGRSTSKLPATSQVPPMPSEETVQDSDTSVDED